MTATAELNRWRMEQKARGHRIGLAEEIDWLCGQIDRLAALADRCPFDCDTCRHDEDDEQ